MKKVYTGSGQPQGFIRNRASGWTMTRDFELPNCVRDIAKQAVSCLEYDFGAVDIAQLRDGKFTVFEVNRTPGLDARSAEVYAKAFINIALQQG